MADRYIAMLSRSRSRKIRWLLFAVAVLALLAGAGVVGFRLATEQLKGKVASALGPGSNVAALRVGWSAIEVEGLTIEGPTGWPAPRSLHAERMAIVPSLKSLLTDRVQIASITVDKPYLSMLRTEGKLRLIPTLLGAGDGKRMPTGSRGAESSHSVAISAVVLKDGVIELFDATVGPKPLKIRLEQIQAVVRGLDAPGFRDRIQFELTGVAKGVSTDGRVKVSGWLASGGKDSSSRIVLSGVDLVKLQPYLVRAGEARVSRGTLDLDLVSDVRNHILDGKGKVALRRLEFEPSRGLVETFMGVPRAAIISFMKDRDDAIDVDFSIKGDIRNPKFSLNEAVATRIAAAVAELLGVSIRGVTGTLEFIGRKSLEGVGEAAGAVGSALKGIFGGEGER